MRTKRHFYEKEIKVFCRKCREWINEREVEFVDIQEGIEGEDQMTFRCPKCKTKSTSTRVG